MKKFIYILLVTLFGVAKADAQSEPVYNVPCPEVPIWGCMAQSRSAILPAFPTSPSHSIR